MAKVDRYLQNADTVITDVENVTPLTRPCSYMSSGVLLGQVTVLEQILRDGKQLECGDRYAIIHGCLGCVENSRAMFEILRCNDGRPTGTDGKLKVTEADHVPKPQLALVDMVRFAFVHALEEGREIDTKHRLLYGISTHEPTVDKFSLLFRACTPDPDYQ